MPDTLREFMAADRTAAYARLDLCETSGDTETLAQELIKTFKPDPLLRTMLSIIGTYGRVLFARAAAGQATVGRPLPWGKG